MWAWPYLKLCISLLYHQTEDTYAITPPPPHPKKKVSCRGVSSGGGWVGGWKKEKRKEKKKTRTTFQWRKVPPGQQHAKYKYETISHFGMCTRINTTFKRLFQCVCYTLLKFPSFPPRPSLHISSLNFHFWFPVVSQTREKTWHPRRLSTHNTHHRPGSHSIGSFPHEAPPSGRTKVRDIPDYWP